MNTSLPSGPAGRGVGRWAAAALGLGLGLATAPAYAQTPTIYGLGTLSQTLPAGASPFLPAGGLAGTQGLLTINPTTGAVATAPILITGVIPGQRLVGIDSRPNTGQLFALGYDATAATGNARLYRLNVATGVATSISASAITLALGTATDRIGFDFNPTVDRIRVEGSNNKNFRLDPNTGAVAGTDLDLNYAAPNAALDPFVGTVAYTNSYAGSTGTTLYALDEAGTGNANNGFWSVQTPPNNGVLTAPQTVALGSNPFGNPLEVDVDVYFNPTTLLNEAYLSEVTVRAANGRSSSNFYTFNLGTGATTFVGNTVPNFAGSPFDVIDIAAGIAPLSQPALTGQLVYAVAAGNLVSFDSGAPGTIRSAVNITGLPTATGLAQVLAGADFRPATGELFALGYNASDQTGQLYTLNLSSGALTAVGSLIAYPLGTTAASIGFDFNPTVDRIRVTSASNQANLRVNPTDGTFLTDTPLNNVAGLPAISAVAYTNNDNNAASGTTLYAYDQTRNLLLRSTNANGGVYVDQGASGLSVNAAGVDFDIFTNNTSGANSAFAAAAPAAATADNLYAVNLGSGAFTAVGRIGLGSNVTALAVFLTPAAAANVLAWTGLSSTDYGTAGNWNPQAVPTATSNVLIPSAPASQPTVSTAQAALNLTIDAGASLATAPGGTLNVGGNLANAGTLAGSGSGTVALVGPAAQTVGGAGSTRFRNLALSNAAGASLSGAVGVSGALRLTAGTLTTTGQVLTLLSDASGTGLVDYTGGGALNGPLTAQRFIDGSLNGGLGYRHFSSPVDGENLNTLATTGFTPVFNTAYNTATQPGLTTPFPTVYGYNQGRLSTSPVTGISDFDKGWNSPTAGAPMLPNTGYTVNIGGGLTVDFTGTATVSNYQASGLSRGPLADAGWQLLGNPFPAPLNWQALVDRGGLTGLDNALYVFKSSGQYGGSYASYVNGIGNNGGSSTLPLAQGFFVRVSSVGAAGAISLQRADLLAADNGTAFQRGAADVRPLVQLSLASATARLQTTLYFDAAASAAVEARADAAALPSLNDLTLASLVGAEALAINGLPALSGADVRVPLQVAAATAGPYVLAAEALTNLPAGYHAYLHNVLANTYTDLATTPRVALALPANGPALGRYALLFSTQARVLATAPAALAALASVYPNPAHGTATLLLPKALRGPGAVVAEIRDNLGRVVLTRTFGTDTLELPLAGLAPGLYTVQVRTAAGLVSKKLVVE